MAPVGTVAVMLVAVAAVTVALVAPKNTMLLAAVVLKPLPVSVTASPGLADAGLKEVMTGPGIKVNPETLLVPPGVVTETEPEAPAPTTAVMVVAFTTEKEEAGVPPKLTAVAPSKLLPVMVMVVPDAADAGLKEVMTGNKKVNPLRSAVPPGVVTETEPDAPVPTTAVMVVAFTTEKEEAAVPPNLTAVAPVKLLPVMVMVVPDAAEAGLKEVMTGAGIKVKPEALLAVPPGVVTETEPEAPVPTTAVMVVAFTTEKEEADVPPKLTAVASVKLLPVMVMVAPDAAEAGLKELITGATYSLRKTETVLELKFATARSGLPSPFTSPMATE